MFGIAGSFAQSQFRVRSYNTLPELLSSVPASSEYVAIIKGSNSVSAADGFALFYIPNAVDSADNINIFTPVNVAGRWFKIKGMGGGGGGGGGGGDMFKATYDTNINSIADWADHIQWTNISSIPSTFPASNHTHTASQISDSTSAGRSVLTATDAAAQRTAIGLGTAAVKDAPVSGDATSGQVVLGSDTRLTNARTPSAGSSATLISSGIVSNSEFDTLDGVTSSIQTQLNSKVGNAFLAPLTNYVNSYGSNSIAYSVDGQNYIRFTHIPKTANIMIGPNSHSVFGTEESAQAIIIAGDTTKGDPAKTRIWSGLQTATDFNFFDLKTTDTGLIYQQTQGDSQSTEAYIHTQHDRLSTHGTFDNAAGYTIQPKGVVGQSGTNTWAGSVDAPFFFNSMDSGIATNKLMAATWNRTNKFLVMANSGFSGTGTNFLADDGTYKSAGGGAPSGPAGGDLTGTYPNPTLATSGVTNGSYGSASLIPTFAVDAKGRITAVTNIAVSGGAPSGPAGGALAGTYPNPSLAGGVTAGTYRSVTVLTNGLVSAGTSPTTFSGYGLSDTSANLAAALTDEVGTGASLFSLAPTITNLMVSETVGNSGLIVNGATQTSSNSAVLISQTWNASATNFNVFKVNATTTSSATNSTLMDLQTNGVTAAKFTQSGDLQMGSRLRLGTQVMLQEQAGTGLYVRNSADTGWGYIIADIFQAQTRVTAGSAILSSDSVSINGTTRVILQSGYDQGTSSFTVQGQGIKSGDGSGTDQIGSDTPIAGGRSTGTGRGGAIFTSTSLSAASTGSGVNGYSTRSFVSAKPVDLTESSATLFANITLPTGNVLGCILHGTVYANDGTDFQVLKSHVNIGAVNKAGTVTTSLTQTDGTTAASSGTLTCTYTAVANGSGVDIKANAVSSLTQTVLRVKWSIVSLDSDGAATVTPQ